MKRPSYIGDKPGLASGGAIPWPVAALPAINAGASTAGVETDPNGRIKGPEGTISPTMTAANAPSPYTVGGQGYNSSTGAVTLGSWPSGAIWGVMGSPARLFFSTYPSDGSSSGPAPMTLMNTGGNYGILNPAYEWSLIFGGVGINKRYTALGIKSAYNGREPRGWKIYAAMADTGPWTLLDTHGPFVDAAGIGTSALKKFAINNPQAWDFYKIVFTHTTPVPTGTTQYIDIAEIKFYEAGAAFNAQTVATAQIQQPDNVAVQVRVGGITTTPPLCTAGRDGGTTLRNVPLEHRFTFADGSRLYAGDATVSGQPAGSNVVARFTLPSGAVLLGANIGGAV